MQRTMVVVLAALLGALGCKGKSHDDPSAGEFANDMLAAFSERAVECDSTTADAARQQLLYYLDADLITLAQDAGRLELDADKAQECLDWVASASCAELELEGPKKCVDALVPKVEEGGSCTLFLDGGLSAECIEGECVTDSFLACVTGGTCLRLAKEGEACRAWPWYRSCASDLACEGETNKCVPVVIHTAVGDPCDEEIERCGGDLVCVSTVFASPSVIAVPASTCQARVAVDQPCSSSDQCERGAYCNVTCQLYKKLDEACTLGSYECVTGAFCDSATSKCTAWPTVGQPCGSDGYEYRSCVDSWCEYPQNALVGMPLPTPPGTCRAFKAVGETCTPDVAKDSGGPEWQECGPAGWCDPESHACIPFYCGGGK